VSDDNRELEQVEAEIVSEGRRIYSMPDMGEAPHAPEPDFSGSDSTENSGGYSGNAGGYSESATGKAENTTDSTGHKFYYTDRRPIFALLSLGIGALSVITCCFRSFSFSSGIAAVVLGIISMNKEPEAKQIAIIGILCGVIAVALFIVGAVVGGVASGIAGLFNMLFGWIF